MFGSPVAQRFEHPAEPRHPAATGGDGLAQPLHERVFVPSLHLLLDFHRTEHEQLFAAGYAACFQSALLRIAAGRKLDLSDSRITARVGIGTSQSGGFGLAAALDLDAPQLTRELGLDLMRRAHQACPYSRATRGNIEVTLSVGGVPADEARAAA